MYIFNCKKKRYGECFKETAKFPPLNGKIKKLQVYLRQAFNNGEKSFPIRNILKHQFYI